MDIMSWIIWLVIGGIIGWIASIIMGKNARMGLVANVVAGCVGAWVGGFIHSFIPSLTAQWWGWVFAILGAIIVIAIVGLFMPKQQSA